MRNKNASVSDPNSFFSSRGDDWHELYSPVVLADGSLALKVSGRIDIQKEIDSQRDSTDMAFILRKLGVGDDSVLKNGKTPFYGDFSRMPTNPAEFLQLAIDSEKAFSELPLEVRNQYENNYRKWFADVGSEKWYNAMESVLPQNSSAASPITPAASQSEALNDNNE